MDDRMTPLLILLIAWPLVSFPIAWIVGLILNENDDPPTRRRHSEARPLAPDAPLHRRPLPPTSAGRASGRRSFNRNST